MVELVVWDIWLAHIKDLEMSILLVHEMEYLEDGTKYGKIDGLFFGISLGREDRTVLWYSSRSSVGYLKGSKYDDIDAGVDGEVNILAIWVI